MVLIQVFTVIYPPTCTRAPSGTSYCICNHYFTNFLSNIRQTQCPIYLFDMHDFTTNNAFHSES